MITKDEMYDKYKFLKCELEFDNGWNYIVDSLLTQIQKSRKRKDFEIAQIKEKYSVLYVYTYNTNEHIEQLIRSAQEKSKAVCEICGSDGEICKCGTWYKTLCVQHAKELNYIPLTNIE